MNHLLKSEDDDIDFAPEERKIYAEKKGFNVWYIIIGILALIPYICIPILFAMVSNIDQSGDTNNVSHIDTCIENIYPNFNTLTSNIFY